MKYVLIGPVYPYKGGIAHFTTFLAHAIDHSDHETALLSFERLYPLWLYPGITDKDPSVRPPWPLDAEYISDPMLPWTWHKMSKRVLELQPDAVIIQWWTSFFAPMLFHQLRAYKKAGIDVIFLIHNVFPHENKPWHRWISKLVLSMIDKFIVQSQAELQKLRALRPDAQILLHEHPLYRWPDLQILPKDEAKQALGLDKQTPALLFFGFVRPYKGLENLLYAAQILKKDHIHFKMLVVGEFWEDASRYRHIIKKLQIEDYVLMENKYIPNQSMNLYFSAADIFLAPYLGGTQSGVVKTAIAYDLPIVGSSFLIPAESNFYDPVKHIRLNSLKPEDIATAIESALRTDIAGQPRSLPAWEQTGWSSLVEAIEQLTNLHPGISNDDHG